MITAFHIISGLTQYLMNFHRIHHYFILLLMKNLPQKMSH